MLSGPYRAGPWPGLTPSGAIVLLACAAFLAVGQVMIGLPRQPVPDLALVGGTALLPMALAVRIVRVPGAASGTCAAYLLPRSLIALFQPALDQPPVLLVPAILFDLSLWLLTTHAAQLTPRLRALTSGAIFGVTLGLVEPSFRQFLGADASIWSGPVVWLGAGLSAAVCAAVATVLSGRDRAR